jgi:hypothetical protein
MLKHKKNIITTKELFLLLVLIPALFLAINTAQNQQIYKQQAATIIGCGSPGDKGNNMGVGKYCTKGGGQCMGNGAPYCAADFKSDVPGVCSKPCASDNDCGTGAKCSGSGLERGCEPLACSAPPPSTPTPTQKPTPTSSPTKAPTAQPTARPTAVPNPVIISATPTNPIPSVLTTPTPTLKPNSTAISFTVFFHGVGNSGDNANPTINSLSNKMPRHPARPVSVSIFNASDELLATKNGLLIYESSAGTFNGVVDLGTDFAGGNYIVKIKSDGYLRKQLPGIQIIQPASTTTTSNITLVTGDTNGDNMVNALDYNTIIECFSDLLSKTCNDKTRLIADLNDDDKVNQVDYNLLLREISVQNGD